MSSVILLIGFIRYDNFSILCSQAGHQELHVYEIENKCLK